MLERDCTTHRSAPNYLQRAQLLGVGAVQSQQPKQSPPSPSQPIPQQGTPHSAVPQTPMHKEEEMDKVVNIKTDNFLSPDKTGASKGYELLTLYCQICGLPPYHRKPLNRFRSGDLANSPWRPVTWPCYLLGDIWDASAAQPCKEANRSAVSTLSFLYTQHLCSTEAIVSKRALTHPVKCYLAKTGIQAKIQANTKCFLEIGH